MAKSKKIVKKVGKHAVILPGMNYAQSQQYLAQTKQSVVELSKSQHQRVLRDRQAQRMGWLYQVALNEKYGFGAKRLEMLEIMVKRMAGEYNSMVSENGQDYADEKLRQQVCKVRGREIKYLYDDLYPVNPERPEGSEEAACAALGEADNRIY